MHQHQRTSNIIVAAILNIIFTFIEFFGGLLTNSLAILSDALHDFGDSLVLFLAWFAEKKSQKEPDIKKTFGYKRLSLFSAIFTSLVLVSGSTLILIKAIPRLLHPQVVNSQLMIYIAIVGVICNGIGTLKLKSEHEHNRNQKALTWHLLEDVLGWIAVLTGSIIIKIFNIPIIDPIMTIAYTTFILWNVWKNLKENMNILMEGIPEHIDFHQIRQNLLKIPNISDIHDIHIWSLDGEHSIFTGHFILSKSVTSTLEIKKQIKKVLLEKEISHSTIEFELKNECSGIDCVNQNR